MPRLFGADDVQLLQMAGDRAALAINGRLTEQERGLADALQRSLIPRHCPTLPGLTLDARYLPAAEAKLGGDWYDAFLLAGRQARAGDRRRLGPGLPRCGADGTAEERAARLRDERAAPRRSSRSD